MTTTFPVHRIIQWQKNNHIIMTADNVTAETMKEMSCKCTI